MNQQDQASTSRPRKRETATCLRHLVWLLGMFVLTGWLAGCTRDGALIEPEAGLEQAWNYYRLAEFDMAIGLFEQVIRQTSPTDALHLQAIYGLATTWNLRRPGPDQARAEALYRELAALAPESDYAAWSLLALARMQHLVPVGEKPDYATVRQAYQEVVDRFPNHPAGEEAFIHQQATYLVSMRQEDAGRAIERLGAFVEAHPRTGFVSSAYDLMSTCYAVLEQPERRLQAAIRAYETMELDPDNPNLDFALTYWQIATVAEFEAGDFDTARAFYRRLIDEYPTDQKVFPAKQALDRMDRLEAGLRAELSRESTP